MDLLEEPKALWLFFSKFDMTLVEVLYFLDHVPSSFFSSRIRHWGGCEPSNKKETILQLVEAVDSVNSSTTWGDYPKVNI